MKSAVTVLIKGSANMLHGFSVPLTPQGRSALASPPPWHYSSDCLAIEYWADPAAIAALLPPGVTSDEKSGGRAFFWFLDWQFTASNDEITDPARYQYREAFVLVEAVFDGKPANYCPYIFVDNDAAIARGWAQGFPKKLASVYQTRSFSAPSAAAAPLAKGSRFGASVSAHGERLATARIQLEEPVADPTTVFNRPTTMRRNTGAEPASLRKRGSGRARRRESPRLVDTAQFLRKPLRPSASDGRVIVDEYIRAEVDGCALEKGLDEHEGFAVLVARRVGDLVV